MIENRHIGTARDYDELHALLRARVDELGVTFEGVDAVAGLPQRYTAKLLAPIPMKAIGKTSMGPLLGALGLKLIVAVDDEMLARIEARLTKRARKPSDAGSTVLAHRRRKRRRYSAFKASPDFAKVVRAKQYLAQSETKRKRIARTAAKARWSKPRVVEITNSTARKGTSQGE